MKKEVVYKHGSWLWKDVESIPFNKDKLMLSLVEKLKSDIENHYSCDKNAQKMVNDLLYHFCWKMVDNEKN